MVSIRFLEHLATSAIDKSARSVIRGIGDNMGVHNVSHLEVGAVVPVDGIRCPLCPGTERGIDHVVFRLCMACDSCTLLIQAKP